MFLLLCVAFYPFLGRLLCAFLVVDIACVFVVHVLFCLWLCEFAVPLGAAGWLRYYRNEFYLCGFYRCVNSGESLTH